MRPDTYFDTENEEFPVRYYWFYKEGSDDKYEVYLGIRNDTPTAVITLDYEEVLSCHVKDLISLQDAIKSLLGSYDLSKWVSNNSK